MEGSVNGGEAAARRSLGRKRSLCYAASVILGYLSVLGDAPETFFVLVGALMFSVLSGLIFHEYCHAYVADRLGDHTARLAGRLSLDPRRHWDPIGTTLILIVGFGWAKPVPVNPFNTRNPRQAMATIAAAGPLSNLSVAALAGIPIKLGWVTGAHPLMGISPTRIAQFATDSPENMLGFFLGTVVLINVILAVFNFVPLVPLDGSRVVAGLLPPGLAREYDRLTPWAPGILMLLILLPFIAGWSPLFEFWIEPVGNVFLNLFASDIQIYDFRS